jgi:hypothetical protein
MVHLRVPMDELEEGDDFDSFVKVGYRGQPFTGVAFEEHPLFVSEYRYQDGFGHGRCISTFREGPLMEEFFLERGREVGESKAWFANGRLRRHVHHGPPKTEQRWDERGQLLEDFDGATGVRRRWDPAGALRSVTTGRETKVFTTEGLLAFSWSPRTEVKSKIYDCTTFVPEVMTAHLEALADEHDFEHHVFAWVHQLLDAGAPEGVPILARLVAHPNLWVKTTAMRLVGNRGVRALEPDLRALLDDARVPPLQRFDHGSRSATRSVGQVARQVLAQLQG